MRAKIVLAIYFLLVIVSNYAVTIYAENAKKVEIESFNNESLRKLDVAYRSIWNTFKIVTKIHADNIIRDQKLLSLLRDFKYESDPWKRSLLRGELYRHLYGEYDELKSLGIRQLHFHTCDGKSLLRFHFPSKNGDSLAAIRKSIRDTNEKLVPSYGFEGGRIYSGFRYVFPVMQGSEHLGSVELSIPFDTIEKELQAVLPAGYQLHQDKASVYEKIFDPYKDIMLPSPVLSDHYIENPHISEVEKKIASNRIVNRLYPLIAKNAEFRHMQHTLHNFSINIFDGDGGYSILFLDIRDTEGKHGAYLVSYSRLNILLEIEKRFDILTIILDLAVVIILTLGYVVYRQFESMRTQGHTLQNLIDMQENIILLSNGIRISYANRKFFDFFGIDDLSEFLDGHRCVCETFIRDDAYFHLGKLGDKSNWIEAIMVLPHAQRIVSIADTRGAVHIFTISFNRYDNDLYIFSFTDITATVEEKSILREKTIHDKLTGVYNREYFDQTYTGLLEECRTQQYLAAFAIIDIDLFKRVNDTYGHDTGDRVLMEFASRIDRYSRKEDILIRWGGEEFVLSMKVKEPAGLQTALEHIRQVIAAEPFEGVGSLTCSIGGTLYREGEEIGETIKRADEALYLAKERGRNCTVIV